MSHRPPPDPLPPPGPPVPVPPAGPLPRGAPARVAVWALHAALPLLGLWLLVAQPHLDLTWEDHLSHFWLVLLVAAVNVGVGARMSEAARRRTDARLFLASLAFLSSAGFLLVHALATPGVLVPGPNAGFVVATPAGLLLAAGFAAASGFQDSPRWAARTMRLQGPLRWGLAAILVAWAGLSLLRLPPLDLPLAAAGVRDALTAMAAAGVVLYAVAAGRYYRVYRRRPAVVLLSVTTAFVLLAEAMVAVAYARPWRVSWWEWHLLMLLAFGFVAYSAHVEYRREGSAVALFHSVSLEHTLRRVREEYAEALEALVLAIQRRASGGGPVGPLAHRLAERFGITEGQVQVLEGAAEALAHEREQILRLGALVAIGHQARVILDEAELLRRAVAVTGDAFGEDSLRVGLLEEGGLRFPPELRAGGGRSPDGESGRPAEPVAGLEAADRALRSGEPVEVDLEGGALVVLPLTVKDRAAGVLEVRRRGAGFAERDRWLLRSLASQLSIALENARLYRQLDALFRSYMSPQVATALLADPSQASLGGAIVEVTVLFADLQGFTTFAEASSPEAVVAMLNDYYGMAVPLVLGEGGTVVQFVGDALMAVFNAPVRQPDHALRAARAALALQRAVEPVAAHRPGWPHFRVGINTGPALVGNVGSPEIRNFTAIGDTTNLAARLETAARPGQVVIGEATYRQIREVAAVEPLGSLTVKGKREPVRAYSLTGLRA